MKRTIILCAVALLVFTGCSRSTGIKTETHILTCSAEGSTKIGFDRSGVFYWSKADHLGVTTASNPLTFTKLDLSSGGGTGNATFLLTGDSFGDYALYPYHTGHSVTQEGVLTYHLPQTYSCTAVDKDFFTTPQGDGHSFNPPMWGKIVGNTVTIKHLGGVVCFKFKKIGTAAGKFILTADRKINGDFTADLTDTTPTLVTQATENSAEKQVEIIFGNADPTAAAVFYVPVPAGSYTLRFKLLDQNGQLLHDLLCGDYRIERTFLQKIQLGSGNIDISAPEPMLPRP